MTSESPTPLKRRRLGSLFTPRLPSFPQWYFWPGCFCLMTWGENGPMKAKGHLKWCNILYGLHNNKDMDRKVRKKDRWTKVSIYIYYIWCRLNGKHRVETNRIILRNVSVHAANFWWCCRCFEIIIHEGTNRTFWRYTNCGVELLVWKETARMDFLLTHHLCSGLILYEYLNSFKWADYFHFTLQLIHKAVRWDIFNASAFKCSASGRKSCEWVQSNANRGGGGGGEGTEERWDYWGQSRPLLSVISIQMCLIRCSECGAAQGGKLVLFPTQLWSRQGQIQTNEFTFSIYILVIEQMLLFKATYSWKTQADMQLRLVCINRNFLKAPN